MARRSVTITTPPASDPVTLDEAKAFAKVDGTDEDALITSLITAAATFAEQYLRRSLVSQTLKLTLDMGMSAAYRALPEGTFEIPLSAFYGGLPDVIELTRGPVQSVSSVVTYDTSNAPATFSTDNYRVDTAGGRVHLNETATWPSPLRQFAAAEITYVAGYGDTAASVPQPIRTGILTHVQRMYDARIVCDLPDDCRMLLGAYRVMDGR
jgi:hypothetical protein